MTHLIMVQEEEGNLIPVKLYFLVVTKYVNNVLHDERKNLDKPLRIKKRLKDSSISYNYKGLLYNRK